MRVASRLTAFVHWTRNQPRGVLSPAFTLCPLALEVRGAVVRHHVSLGEVVVACRRNARVRFRIHFVPIDTGTWKTYVSQGLLGRILHQLTDFATSLNAFDDVDVRDGTAVASSSL